MCDSSVKRYRLRRIFASVRNSNFAKLFLETPMQTFLKLSSHQRLRVISCHSKSLFTLPDFSSLSPFSALGGGSEKQTFHERKILPYTRQQLYDVVANVDAYNRFVPFCTGSRVLSKTESKHSANSLPTTKMEAELTVGFMNFTESYVSEVICIPHESVQAIASSTSTPLFKSLETTWRFRPAPPQSPHATKGDPPSKGLLNTGPTLVSYDIAFAFANPIHAAVSTALFGQVSKLMIKAFEEHCIQVYGEGKQ